MSRAPGDRVWKALADPTRRRLLDLLQERAMTTGELCERFPRLARVSVMKHLAVLERASLVVSRREGRRRWNHLNPIPLQQACERWMSRHVASLAASLLRLKRHVENERE